MLILPVWIVQIAGLGLFIYMFWHYKKLVDKDADSILREAKVMSAKAQLVIIKKLKAKGHTIDESMIEELEGVINGKRKVARQYKAKGTT